MYIYLIIIYVYVKLNFILTLHSLYYNILIEENTFIVKKTAVSKNRDSCFFKMNIRNNSSTINILLQIIILKNLVWFYHILS